MSELRHYRRVDEGHHAFGGEATCFLEIDEAGDAVRQVEVYPGGRVLRYSKANAQDEWGALSVMVVDGDVDDWTAYAITREEFERVWQETAPPA